MPSNKTSRGAFVGAVKFCMAGFLVAGQTFAHHSFASTYFMDQKARIEGTLIEFALRSPHSFVQIEAQDPKTGGVVTWVIEWGSTERLNRQGVTKETLKPG